MEDIFLSDSVLDGETQTTAADIDPFLELDHGGEKSVHDLGLDGGFGTGDSGVRRVFEEFLGRQLAAKVLDRRRSEVSVQSCFHGGLAQR